MAKKEKYEKICVKIYAEYFKKFLEKKIRDLHFLCHLI